MLPFSFQLNNNAFYSNILKELSFYFYQRMIILFLIDNLTQSVKQESVSITKIFLERFIYCSDD